jgi:regulatory protein
MKITSYEPQKRNKEKLNVFVDGEYSFSITMNGWAKNFLWVGKEITQEDIEKYKIGDGKELALDKALTILGTLKTRHEVEEKLKEKEFEDEDIEYAVSKAMEYGYINDAYYVKCYILERGIPNKWGENKIMNNLLQKGVDKEVIQEGLDLYFKDEDSYEIALNCAIKKYDTINKSKYDDYQIKSKLLSFLTTKGFSYETSCRAAQEVMDTYSD